jgi:hypothetical protein
MVGEVSANPTLNFADDLSDDQLKHHLPIVNYRGCGSTAWAGLKRQRDSFISGKLEDFYPAFFGDDPKVTFPFPEESGAQNRPLEAGIALFCAQCLTSSSGSTESAARPATEMSSFGFLFPTSASSVAKGPSHATIARIATPKTD